MNEIRCPKCGVKSGSNSPFCLNCGATIQDLRIVDMRPSLKVETREGTATVSGEKPNMVRTRTSYRSGVLEAKSLIERERGAQATTEMLPLPMEVGQDTVTRDRTVWFLAAVALLLVIIMIILIVVITTYI